MHAINSSVTAMSLDHSYSLPSLKRPSDNTFSTTRHTKRSRWLTNTPVPSSSNGESVHRMPSSPRFHPEDSSRPVAPLARLFPDCILCVWSTNVYSNAVVADLHTRAVEYAGDERPHVAAYSACVDDWYEFHTVAELAPTLTKEGCVAHFTSNILCRFNRQRCQPPSLFNRKLVSRLVDICPSNDNVVFVNNCKRECGEGNATVYWCPNAFSCFLTVQFAKLFDLTLPEKKRRHIYAVLHRHTDTFVSQWLTD